MSSTALSCGLVVDYPNSTRAKKYFLVLAAGPPESLPTAKTGEGSDDEGDGCGVRMDGRGGAGGHRLGLTSHTCSSHTSESSTISRAFLAGVSSLLSGLIREA